MEMYILDRLRRRVGIVDVWESLIWTERLNKYGDFELHVMPTLRNRTLFSVGTDVAIDMSYRVATVETVEDSVDSSGKAMLKITGRTLERILDSRVAAETLTGITSETKWTITNKPADIARKLFHDICVTGTLSANDIIPGITEASIFPEDTIDEPTEVVTYEIELKSLYTALSDICLAYDMGFRIVRDPNTSQLYFDVFTGSDRTTAQTTLPAVVFSPNLDNLQNTTELTTITSYKNVAYVISKVGHEEVFAPEVDPDSEGFERHVLLVKADDITDEDAEVASAKMIQRGKDELAKYRRISAFDGELSQHSKYIPGVDYNLGDLVELQNITGSVDIMQVTEQIFVSDNQGERYYPTLTINRFITPGSWAIWDYNRVWADMGDDDYWSTV